MLSSRKSNNKINKVILYLITEMSGCSCFLCNYDFERVNVVRPNVNKLTLIFHIYKYFIRREMWDSRLTAESFEFKRVFNPYLFLKIFLL